MNKSTPLSQLPSGNSPSFVSDQQRQYITQAQQAIGNSPIPQNTQISSDIINDDDAVVQDILNQINASTSATPPQTTNVQQQQMQQHQQALQQQEIQAMIAAQQQQQQQQHAAQQQMMQQQLLMQQMAGPSITPQIGFNPIASDAPKDYRSLIMSFTDDIKLAGLVFVTVLLVHFIPANQFLGKYIAIEKIPYHNVILRAIMVTLIVIIVKKLLKL